MSGYKHQKVWDQIEEEMILENNKQKWLLLQMQGNLNFNTYIYIYFFIMKIIEFCKHWTKKSLNEILY